VKRSFKHGGAAIFLQGLNCAGTESGGAPDRERDHHSRKETTPATKNGT